LASLLVVVVVVAVAVVAARLQQPLSSAPTAQVVELPSKRC